MPHEAGPPGARDAPAEAHMRLALSGFSRVISGVEWVAMAGAGICFVAIVLITTVDVGLRYIVGRPLIWSLPLISNYLMVAVFYLAVASTQRLGQNVGVDLVVRRLPERARAALAAICMLLALGFVGLLTIAGWSTFLDAWRGSDVQAGAIEWPLWPAFILVPLGSALLCLRLFADVLANAAAACGALDLASHRRVRAHAGFGAIE